MGNIPIYIFSIPNERIRRTIRELDNLNSGVHFRKVKIPVVYPISSKHIAAKNGWLVVRNL